MINNLKLIPVLFRYSINKKGILFSAIIFTLLGLVYLFVMPTGGLICFCGMYFVGMSPLMIFQNLPTLCCSQLIASSEHTKHLTSKTMVMGQSIVSILVYAVQILLVYIAYTMGRFTLEDAGILLATSGLLLGILLIYNVAAYKSFWISTIIFAAGVAVIFILIVAGTEKHTIPGVSPVAGAILGVASVLVCAILAYGLSRLLYRKAWDRKAVDRRLKMNE